LSKRTEPGGLRHRPPRRQVGSHVERAPAQRPPEALRAVVERREHGVGDERVEAASEEAHLDAAGTRHVGGPQRHAFAPRRPGEGESPLPRVVGDHRVEEEFGHRAHLHVVFGLQLEEPQGAGGGGGGGGAGGEADWTPAPLDWQVSALARRVLRDVGMIDGSANIRTVIQQAFQRQRLSEAGDAGSGEGGAGGSSGAKKSKLKGVGKAPWNQTDAGVPLWDPAPETGQYFVKMVQPSGAEINATRKEPTIALADLLPLFPVQEVRPGSGWDTRMVIVAELSSVPRQSFKLENARIRFTNFENVMTPAGHSRRAAKLESYYQLPDNVAKRVAAILSINGGGGSGGGAAGGGGGSEGGSGGGAAAGGATDAEAQEEAIQEAMAEILVARTRGSRLVWFDIDRRLVLRSEDVIDTYYELEGAAAGGATGSSAALMSPALTIRSSAQMGMGRSGMPGPGMPGMMGPGAGGAPGGDAAAAPAEPTIVRYNLRIVTQYDDRVPAPSDAYTAGAMTPNSNWPWNPDYFPAERRPNNRDKSLVRNPTIQRVLPPKPAP